MRQLGRYKLVRLPGAGGMGQVFEAIDGGSQESIAIKVIKSPGGSGTFAAVLGLPPAHERNRPLDEAVQEQGGSDLRLPRLQWPH